MGGSTADLCASARPRPIALPAGRVHASRVAGDLARGPRGGQTPGLADCCLVPQVFNARRFGVDMSAFPTIARIEQACLTLPAFEQAKPENQPDAHA